MKKNLIFISAGDSSLHYELIKDNREFDIFISYYGDNDDIAKKYEDDADFFIKKKVSLGLKSLGELVEKEEFDFSKYKYVWHLDDDMRVSVEQANLLFNIAEEYDLYLCGPCFSINANWPWIQNVHDDSILRYVSMIEQNSVCIKSDILKKISWTIFETEAMWCIEWLWYDILGAPKDKIAMIDSVVIEHTRPGGSDYSRFAIHPNEELRTILYPKHKQAWDKHGITEYFPLLQMPEYFSKVIIDE